MKKMTLIVLALAGLVLTDSWSTQAQASLTMGGQDVLIDNPGVVEDSPLLDVTAASDGTLFAVSHGDFALTVMNIYRSVDGGTTWQLWDQMASQYLDGRVHQAELDVVEGEPEQLIVAWIDQRLDQPSSALRVWMAAVADETPSWTPSAIMFAPGWELNHPRLDTMTSQGESIRVGLAWQQEKEVMFAGSYDNGSTWSAPLAAGTTITNVPIQDVDVVLDNLGVVHLTWVTFTETSAHTNIHYNRAENGGLVLADWAGERSIYSLVNNRLTRVTIAADPELSEEVIIASSGLLWSSTFLRIFTSVDGGQNWSLPNSTAEYYNPDAAWGATGPFLVVDTLPINDLGDSWAVMTRTGQIWTGSALVQHWGQGDVKAGAALALDPSRNDQPMVVGLRTLVGEAEEYALWFNAAWRDAPGYGVPDPHNAHSTGSLPINRPILPGDMNGDGTLELVIIKQGPLGSDVLGIFNRGPNFFYYWNDDVDPESEAALVDLDGDGDREVFWINKSNTHLEGRHSTGNSLAGFPVDLGLVDGPFWISGAQVTGGPEEDVVVAGSSSVHVVGVGGVERPGWPWTVPPVGGLNNGRVALGDVDADGHCDLVVPLTGRVAILDRFSQPLSVFGQGEPAPGTPSLADLDSDGDLEIVIPRLDGTVHLVHHDGTSVSPNWPYDTGQPGLTSQVALADIAGDDRRDLIFMDAQHGIHAVTPAGLVVMRKYSQVPEESPLVDPIVAMIGPEEITVAVGDADSMMRVIGLSGQQEGWPRNMASPILAAAAVGDFDSDGIMEMAVPTTQSLFVLDMGVPATDTRELWTMSGYDPGRSGCVPAEAAISSVETAAVPRVAALQGAVPNPFNPRTTIRFSLAGDVPHASLRVYDVAGRLVRTLRQGPMTAGEHAVVWQGEDESGQAVASGVYFCRLEAGGVAEGRAMVLVR